MPIEFFIPVRVLPKQSFRAAGRSGYTDPRIKANAEELAYYAGRYAYEFPLEGPLRVELVFQFPWRNSDKKRQKARPKDTRPDCDNLCKQVCDVLQACGFYNDDAQLADVHIRKVWTDYEGVQVYLEQMCES